MIGKPTGTDEQYLTGKIMTPSCIRF